TPPPAWPTTRRWPQRWAPMWSRWTAPVTSARSSHRTRSRPPWPTCTPAPDDPFPLTRTRRRVNRCRRYLARGVVLPGIAPMRQVSTSSAAGVLLPPGEQTGERVYERDGVAVLAAGAEHQRWVGRLRSGAAQPLPGGQRCGEHVEPAVRGERGGAIDPQVPAAQRGAGRAAVAVALDHQRLSGQVCGGCGGGEGVQHPLGALGLRLAALGQPAFVLAGGLRALGSPVGVRAHRPRVGPWRWVPGRWCDPVGSAPMLGD